MPNALYHSVGCGRYNQEKTCSDSQSLGRLCVTPNGALEHKGEEKIMDQGAVVVSLTEFFLFAQNKSRLMQLPHLTVC